MKNITLVNLRLLCISVFLCFCASYASAHTFKSHNKVTTKKLSGPDGGKLAKSLAVKAFSDTTLLFEPKRDGYTMFHVPSMVITKKGTVLAFAEGRFGQGKDWDDIDLVMRRSTDNGKSWEAMKIIVPHTKGKPTSNLTPIADDNGTVHVLYQVNYENAYYMESKDEGKSWTSPVNITYAFNKFKTEYPWHVLAPGPGHAIQMASGRLLVPVWLCIPNRKMPGGDHRPSCVATIYSDDHGKTWDRGKIIVNNGDIAANGDTIVNPNESVVVQLSDGRIMINMRNENLTNKRLVSYSNDGISGWTKPAFDADLFEPVCMASMLKLNSGTHKPAMLLFVNPDSRNDARPTKKGRPVFKPRKNITARLSYDEGKTWPVHKTLFEGGSGYSDLAIDKKGLVYCLYEKEDGKDNGWRYRIIMHRFNLPWLTAGNN